MQKIQGFSPEISWNSGGRSQSAIDRITDISGPKIEFNIQAGSFPLPGGSVLYLVPISSYFIFGALDSVTAYQVLDYHEIVVPDISLHTFLAVYSPNLLRMVVFMHGELSLCRS